MPTFEFDERKSRMNLTKHGIDFVQAQALWNDPRFVEIQAKTEDESRFLVIVVSTVNTGQPLLLQEAIIFELFRFAGLA